MRKLYYSQGSPYARKVRIVLAEKGLDYERDETPLNRPIEDIAPINPNLQVPVFEEDGLRLFESNLIIDYLLQTHPGVPEGCAAPPPPAPALTRPEHHWEDAKILASLETMGISMVNIRHMGLNGVNAEGAAYPQRHHARIQYTLDWLEARATPEGFAPGLFSVMDISLLCPLTFSEVRGDIFPWRGRANLEAIVARHAGRPSVKATAPDVQPV